MFQFNEEIGKSVKGIVHLSSSQVISRIIGAFGGLVVIRILGPLQFGLASIALILPSILATFSNIGITPAMTKFIAEYRNRLELHKVKLVIYSGIIVVMSISFLSIIFCYFIAELISQFLFTQTEGLFLTRVASIQIPALAVYDISWAVFLGFEETDKNSILVVTRTLIQPILSLILVLLGFQALGMIFGITLTGLGIGTVGMLYILLKTKLDENKITSVELFRTMKELVKFGFPLGISTSLSDKALTHYFIFIAALFTSEIMIGYLNAALKLYSLVSYIVTPISLVLLPIFSKVDQEKEPKVLRTLFKYSTKYSYFLIAPISLFMMFNSKLLIIGILGNAFLPAWWMLILVTLESLFIGFGTLPVWQLLVGQGKTDKILKFNLLRPLIGIPVGLILISEFGILGLLVIRLIVPIFPLILALIEVRRRYGVHIPTKTTLKINCAAIISGALIFFIIQFLTILSIYIHLVLSLFFILLLYSISSIGLKIIKKGEIEQLMQLCKEIQFIYWLLKFMQKFARD